MDGEGLSRAVRQQLGLGRLLPLGDAQDGAWMVERAAAGALRSAASEAMPDVRMGRLRLALADPETAAAPAVPAPPSALPPGPLRIDADFESTPHSPLTTTAELLRAVLLRSADRELGLRVRTVDLRITDLLAGLAGRHNGQGHDGGETADRDGSEGTASAWRSRHAPHTGRTEDGGGDRWHERAVRDRPGNGTHPPAPADDPRGTATAQAVISVPGVTRLAPVLGSALGGLPADAVSVSDTPGEDGRTARRHVRIQLAVAEGSRALDVARSVRHAAEKAAAWDADEPEVPVTVAVLVSAVEPADPGR